MIAGALLLLFSVPAAPVPLPAWTVERATRLLAEPDLAATPASVACFRFMWLPPFPAMRLVSVRTCRGPRGTDLVAKAVGNWSAQSVEPALLAQRVLTADEWEELRVARVRGFWNFIPEAFPNYQVADGASWVFESAVSGEYRVLWQHVPSQTPFRVLCRLMLNKAGIAPVVPVETDLLR